MELIIKDLQQLQLKMDGLVEIYKTMVEASKQESIALQIQRAKFFEINSSLQKKVADLERKAEKLKAKDLYYTTNETILVADAKKKIKKLGHEVLDLCKERKGLNSTIIALTLQIKQHLTFKPKLINLGRSWRVLKNLWLNLWPKRKKFWNSQRNRRNLREKLLNSNLLV